MTATPTVLVGWDGATFSVLDPLMENGTMPFLAQFASKGVRGVLRSTVHPLTPCAWTSLMTGVNPGDHGVFDFVKVMRRSDRYTYVLGTSSDMCSETMWSIAGRNGCRVISLNYPSMFPVKDFPGFAIPGMVHPQYLSRAVHPSSLYSRIRAIPGFEGRQLALDWALERKALQGLPEEEYEDWITFHTHREARWFEILSMLMREERCELSAVLFDGVDKLQHLCYHLLDPALTDTYSSTWAKHMRELCYRYFRQLDQYLEQIVSQAGNDARVFICSDHGFKLAGSHIFYVNVWLEQHGYLRWADGVQLDGNRHLTLESHAGTDTLFDWNATNAFALTASSNAIHIFRRDNDGNGPGVPEHQYESFRNHLIRSLLEFTDPSGKPVVAAVLPREQAFPGERMAIAPDLTLVLGDHSFISVLRADEALKPRLRPYGTHEPRGIFLGSGPGIREACHIESHPIIGVAPTVLYSLGLPVPQSMEGQVIEEAFQPSFLKRNPIRKERVRRQRKAKTRQEALPVREKNEEQFLMEQLKALGYLE
jgi:predicted AlkP superfamily phosphohydrolase/phosphomutase